MGQGCVSKTVHFQHEDASWDPSVSGSQQALQGQKLCVLSEVRVCTSLSPDGWPVLRNRQMSCFQTCSVLLRRQGDFFPFESWALSGAMMGEPDQTSPQASRAPKEADTVCWVLLRRPGDLIPQALQPYPQCSGWESVREDSCSLMAEISQTPTPALGLISPTLLKKTQQDSHLIPK